MEEPDDGHRWLVIRDDEAGTVVVLPSWGEPHLVEECWCQPTTQQRPDSLPLIIHNLAN